MRHCLILVQHRNDKNSAYNDFVGKFYHFPGNKSKSYLNQFKDLPIEFVYYEPTKHGGKGEYFGYGKIHKHPFEDKREKGQFFVELTDYKEFRTPVPLNDADGVNREANSPHYNANNSVRKIAPELLDEVCLDGNVQLSFKADAHLIKVLGEQLIASEKVGILELIKNGYDAHATECVVRIENSSELPSISDDQYLYPELPGPVIIIEDNGQGMDRKIIENGWLRPASTIKTNVKNDLERQRRVAVKNGTLGNYEKLLKELRAAHHNRIPLGEKGVGRFATHRLGRKLIIKSKRKMDDYESILTVNWDDFDQVSDTPTDLEDIGVNLSRQPLSRDYSETGSGTQVIIYAGREGFGWNEKKIEDLNRSIIQLNSPNPNPDPELKRSAFSVSLIVPQLPNLKNDPFDEYPEIFEFVGVVDDAGSLTYDLKFSPPKSVPMAEDIQSGQVDLKTANSKYWKERDIDLTACGSFYFNIKFWYREKPWIDGPSAKMFKDRLSNYGGIAIYRDGINIFPAEWGAQNDWLGLKQAQIKQAWRFSYYSMIGNVEIDQGLNVGLTDKTNREGLIENIAYSDFVELMKASLQGVMQNEWKGKREQYTNLTKDVVRDPKILRDYVKQSHEIHKATEEKYPVEDDPVGILAPLAVEGFERREKLINLSRSMKDMQTSLDLIKESNEMMTEQAGYGLAIAASIHEINKITSNFFYGINAVLKKEQPDKAKLQELLESSSSLQTELKRLSPLRAIRSEKKTQFNILRPINYALSVYDKKLKESDIEVDIQDNGGFEIFARYGVIIQIFTNLIDNAHYWVDTVKTKPRKIVISIDEKYGTVTFSDSGPGIHDSILPYLFQPGYSLKIPRSGLGLYISRYYMQEMKGDLQLLQNPKFLIENMDGAQFLLDFARIRKEA